jgi:uncharacterized membrane protein (DUF106 family)
MFDFFALTLVMPSNVAVAAVMVGIAYAIFSLKVQRKLTNPQKTREIQGRIQQLTKEMNEMAKRREDITAKQAELMPLFKESMQLQMKGMFVILPIFFIIYYGLIPLAFGAFNNTYFNIYIIPFTYSTLFIGSAVVAALIMNVFVMMMDKAKAKKLKQASQIGGPGASPSPNTGSDTNNTK